jgi:hypothetical protein
MESPGDTPRQSASPPRHGFDHAVVDYGAAAGRHWRGFENARPLLPGRGIAMAHEIAKLLLEKAGTFLERTEAIKVALQMGMPLNEIQEYLDWLDSIRPLRPDLPNPPDADEDSAE